MQEYDVFTDNLFSKAFSCTFPERLFHTHHDIVTHFYEAVFEQSKTFAAPVPNCLKQAAAIELIVSMFTEINDVHQVKHLNISSLYCSQLSKCQQGLAKHCSVLFVLHGVLTCFTIITIHPSYVSRATSADPAHVISKVHILSGLCTVICCVLGMFLMSLQIL